MKHSYRSMYVARNNTFVHRKLRVAIATHLVPCKQNNIHSRAGQRCAENRFVIVISQKNTVIVFTPFLVCTQIRHNYVVGTPATLCGAVCGIDPHVLTPLKVVKGKSQVCYLKGCTLGGDFMTLAMRIGRRSWTC